MTPARVQALTEQVITLRNQLQVLTLQRDQLEHVAAGLLRASSQAIELIKAGEPEAATKLLLGANEPVFWALTELSVQRNKGRKAG